MSTIRGLCWRSRSLLVCAVTVSLLIGCENSVSKEGPERSAPHKPGTPLNEVASNESTAQEDVNESAAVGSTDDSDPSRQTAGSTDQQKKDQQKNTTVGSAAEDPPLPDQPLPDQPLPDPPLPDPPAGSIAANRELAEDPEPTEAQLKPLPAPEGAKRFSAEDPIWFDPVRKAVVLDGVVCMRRGVLELLASRGKTHESIVRVAVMPSVVHTVLLLAGAEPGAPASWKTEFKSAWGTEIVIEATWLDANGERRTVDARELIRDVRTKKNLESTWVFAGSLVVVNENNNSQMYLADAHDDFISVSNFPSSLLDLPLESSSQGQQLMFEAVEAKIPPLGTHIRLTMIPQREEAPEPGNGEGDQPADTEPVDDADAQRQPKALE